LLRTLDSGEVRRVGSSVPTHVDVRVIAATNRPLQQMVKEGKFRDDLYFRINVLRVEIPPLRKRPADIVRLAQHFLAMAVLDKRPLVLSEEAKASLQAYGFPGNVRELKNIITAAAVQAAGPEIRVTDLSLEPPTLAEKVEEALMLNQDSSIEEAERAYLKLVLDLAHGNKREAAKLLGLPRTTFLYKLEKYGLL
jgi:DNA-binding NtrC family response regulator